MSRILFSVAVALLAVGQAAPKPSEQIRVPSNRGFGRAVVIGRDLYYFGGGSDQIDLLDTERGRWSRMPLGISSQQLLGDQIDGRLYVLDTFSRRLVRLDPQTGRVRELSKSPTRRVNGTLIAVGKLLYVIGGYTDDVTAANCVAVYDSEADRWSNGPPLPGYRPRDHFHAAAVLAGKLHVVGGLLADDRGQPHWRLDGDRWTACAEPPLHAMWKHAALVAAAGKLYLIAPHPGSPNNQSIEAEHEIHAYDPAADQWSPVGRTPEGMPVGLFAQAVVGDKIYLLGGSASKSVYVFDTSTKTWNR